MGALRAETPLCPQGHHAAGDFPRPCVRDSFGVTRTCPGSPLAVRARGTDPDPGACSPVEQQEPCTGPPSVGHSGGLLMLAACTELWFLCDLSPLSNPIEVFQLRS